MMIERMIDRMIERMMRVLLAGLILTSWMVVSGEAQTSKSEYLRMLRASAEKGWAVNPEVVANWKRTARPSELWGYDSPGHPVYTADVLGYLYQETGERIHAERARDLLADYGDLRQVIPPDYPGRRAEYRNGVPAIANFFIMPPYARAYLRIRGSGVVDQPTREKIERDLAFSLDHTFHFPEWGAHNRAMLRAESLYYGALALPDHPHAARWRQMAETLAADSLNQWEIEDATGYHGVWLYAVFSYANIAGREDVLRSPMIRYYLDYFVQLLTPHGNLADFGDSHWNAGWERFVPVYEKAATLFQNPQYKYVAAELMRRANERQIRASGMRGDPILFNLTVGSVFTDAHRWADDTVPARRPTDGSREVLDDLVGKKFVFRNGWEPESTMMLVNYRDEGDGGRLGRDYLRQTISVEEEKMHHGHADENSIALLMSGGSVLLSDGGYRPDLPSGPFGAWRADYFHNRVVARKNRRDRSQRIEDFLRNSGGYRRVRTQKIDFLKLREADYSRSRLIDEELGYTSDRTVVYLRERGWFVIIDGIRALRSDYFTFTNLWHTRHALRLDEQRYETMIDRIGYDPLPGNRTMLVHFPENGPGKQIGTYSTSRNFQTETAIYQTVSAFYHAGDTEYFVTILQPHDRQSTPADALPRFRLIDVDRPGKAIGLELEEGGEKLVLAVKLDLEMDLAREPVGPRYRYELGRVRYGDFETDGSFLFARIGKDQQGAGKISFAAATMTAVRYRGQALMEALPNTFGLQLDGAPPRTGFSKWRLWEETVGIPR